MSILISNAECPNWDSARNRVLSVFKPLCPKLNFAVS